MSTGAKKILCIGEALIDMICTDRGKSLSEGQHFLKKPGGAPTNVAAAVAALGGTVELIAKVGADPFGRQLIAVMEAFGVSTRWMAVDEMHFTTFAFVSLMEDGERDFVFNRGADGELTVQEVEAVDLSAVAVVHFGSATGFLPGPLQAAYYGLLQKALRQDILISFDPNYRHLLFRDNHRSFIDHSWNFLDCCHFFKVSDEEALLLTGAATLKDAATVLQEKTKAVFAITLGKDGTFLRVDDHTEIVPSIPVKPVDTTGAGDAFVGAVLYQLSAARTPAKTDLADWRRIVGNANRAGARTCEYMGAMEAFRHLSNQIFE
ncbi:MAG TPA: carbohydrate kinase [Puia sp.]|nr:carbohydrate kinase [Puia sp.]